jgi:hypothetical protein
MRQLVMRQFAQKGSGPQDETHRAPVAPHDGSRRRSTPVQSGRMHSVAGARSRGEVGEAPERSDAATAG